MPAVAPGVQTPVRKSTVTSDVVPPVQVPPLHMPPDVESVSVIAGPLAHMGTLPSIGAEGGLTVIIASALEPQPVV